MKKNVFSGLLFKALSISLFALTFMSLPISAQNSVPAPGSGGTFTPSGGGGGFGGPGGPGGGPIVPPPGWGSPWGSGWNSTPSIIINAPNVTNTGVRNVVACGYDAQGNWRAIPLYVAFTWNGVQYNVTVVNAWNPWTDSWDKGIDAPAFNTSYYLNGTNYDFYTVLSTGTYYFNL